MARGGTQAVRIKEITSPGSGGRFIDLIKLPVPLFILVRICIVGWRYKLFALLPVAYIYFTFYNKFNLMPAVYDTLIFMFFALLLSLALVATRFRGGRLTFNRLMIAYYRRWRLRSKWGYFVNACEIKEGPTPKFKKLRFNPDGCFFTFDVSKNNKTSLDVAANAPECASALKAKEVKVDTPEPSTAIVHIAWGDPTSAIVRPGDVPTVSTEKNELPFAVSVHKAAVTILTYLSLLIIGRTQSGKSNIIWSLINYLNYYDIPYRIRVIDPKGGVELPDLKNSPYCIDYCNDASKAEKVIDKADADMHERFRQLSAMGVRHIRIPTVEMPLDILIVDEMLHLKKYDANDKFGLRLSQGAAALHVTWAMSQLSQVDALGRVRDLFPQRICMAVESADVTDAALGTNAEKRGAKASEIDPNNPGVGYMFRDGKRGFTKFRVPLIYDDETDPISKGTPIVESTGTASIASMINGKLVHIKDKTNVRTAVYRLYNSMGRLLYVGIAWNTRKRFAQHGKTQPWWKEVDMSQTEITWYGTRKLAKQQETVAIKTEFPLYNKAENKYRNRETV